MGEPTATQVMLTLPPGIISWLEGRMEKRGGTRRTGEGGESGEGSGSGGGVKGLRKGKEKSGEGSEKEKGGEKEGGGGGGVRE